MSEKFKDRLIRHGITLALLAIVFGAVWGVSSLIRWYREPKPETPIVEERMEEISRQEVKIGQRVHPIFVYRDKETGREYMIVMGHTTEVIELGESEK